MCNKRALIYALIIIAFQGLLFEINLTLGNTGSALPGLCFCVLNGLSKVRVADF